jgi:hypothetical protein
MITTSRLLPLDAVGRVEQDLIHLTGPLQVVARAAMNDVGRAAARVDLRFDAGRVRGVSLKTGARYWVQGIHQSTHPAGNTGARFDVMGVFELLGAALENVQTTRLTLTVRLRVLVPADGRVTVEASEVELLPAPPFGSSSPTTDIQEEVR